MALSRLSILFFFSIVILDYTVSSNDLTVTILAGEPTQQCISVGIVDDEVALEGDETFEVYFSMLEPGVVAREPSEALVTISDDDNGELCVIRRSVCCLAIVCNYL